jgi:hypothetical protein
MLLTPRRFDLAAKGIATGEPPERRQPGNLGKIVISGMANRG